MEMQGCLEHVGVSCTTLGGEVANLPEFHGIWSHQFQTRRFVGLLSDQCPVFAPLLPLMMQAHLTKMFKLQAELAFCLHAVCVSVQKVTISVHIDDLKCFV